MSLIVKIKKRNGSIVDFNPNKIALAVQKAFIAVRGGIKDEKLHEICDNVTAELEKVFPEGKIPSVENVQDLVEKELMQQKFYDVTKAYIIYRYEHALVREEKQKEVLEKIEQNTLTIIKRSEKEEKFSIKNLEKTLSYVTNGYENIIDVRQVTKLCEEGLYEGISTSEIAKALTLSVRSYIERDPAYSIVSSRLLRHILYKEVIGPEVIDFTKLDEQYRQAFVRNIKKAVEIDRASSSLLSYNLEELSSYLRPERDDLLMYLGLQTLYDRYFIRDPLMSKILETPQAFWMRVAMGLAIQETEKEEKVREFYEIISTLRYVPSTPTLFHAGTKHPQLSSCYLTTIEDSLDHIFKCIGDNAQLSKWSGGIGNDWTNLRGTGAFIKGTGVESQGVIPFLKIANDTTVAINRSGRRRGATCAYLELWHYDIEDFIELRRNTGDERRRTHDMNTAVWTPDLFMKRVRDDKTWTLFSPDETADLHHLYGKKFDERYEYYEKLAQEGKVRLHKKINARDLWKKIITMLFETGHPWITFKDPCNIRSPQDHAGIVHSSNLCTEITLNTSTEETAVCNLGSVNLAQHITHGMLDQELLKDTITTAMRMLDNVIDINFYPTKEAKTSNMRHRPVGLGLMGYQDALFLLNIPFDSQESVDFADTSMEIISYYAILGSSYLAKERGTYSSYVGSKWDRGIFPIDTVDLLAIERGEKIPISRKARLDWNLAREHVSQYGMRNSNCMAIAPTATIANISNCFPTIEPMYNNIYVKSNMSGEFLITNHYLIDDLKKLGIWNEAMLEEIKKNDGNIMNITNIPDHLKLKYKEIFNIDAEWFIRIAAERGKWIDQSQSLNIFTKTTSGKSISDIYFLAWNLGLKTTYYLRSLGATSVEKSTIALNKKEEPKQDTKMEIPVSLQTFIQPNTRQTVVQALEAMATQVSVNVPAAPAIPLLAEKKSNLSFCKLDDPLCEVCQ